MLKQCIFDESQIKWLFYKLEEGSFPCFSKDQRLFMFNLMKLFIFIGSLVFFDYGFSEIPVQSRREKIYRQPSSYPYISWETFRSISDFVLDDHDLDCFLIEKRYEVEKDFDPSCVQKGDIVFVHTLRVGDFFSNFHEKIKNKYILITGGHDPALPGCYAKYLDDPKIHV